MCTSTFCSNSFLYNNLNVMEAVCCLHFFYVPSPTRRQCRYGLEVNS
uniref:Uncharacterized protein n=1 Tax=Arundo donax TaxID=35708 RepID=A0A0A9CVL2_ARUDO